MSLAIVTSFSALVIAALFSRAILTASSILNVCAFATHSNNIVNTPEVINQVLIPKIIQTKYPELTREEVEEVRQHFLADSVIKNGEIKEVGGKMFVRMAGKFTNIDELHIDLIDKVNPFQKAFKVLSKNVTTRLLKVISETIESQKIVMTDEEAVLLYRKIGDFINKHNREPKLNSTDPLERRMAEAIVFLKNKKRNKSN